MYSYSWNFYDRDTSIRKRSIKMQFVKIAALHLNQKKKKNEGYTFGLTVKASV